MKRSQAFTIAETMIIIMVLAVVGAFVATAVRSNIQKAQAEAAITEVAGLKKTELEALVKKLTSGKRSQTAEALGMKTDELDNDLLKNFASTKMTFDVKTAESIEDDLWNVEADIVEKSGKKSRWTVVVARTEKGLVFIDSAPVQEKAER